MKPLSRRAPHGNLRVLRARRVAGVACALLLGFAAAPAQAAAPVPALTITANGTAETDLVLRQGATLDPAATWVTGAGQFGGWALLRSGSRTEVIASELRVRRWTTPSGPLLTGTGYEGLLRLPAGRYRLVVFADKPTRVMIPIRTGQPQALAANRATTAQAQLHNLLDSTPLVTPQSRVTLTYPGAFVLSQVYFRARAHQVELVAQCFAPAAEHTNTCVNHLGVMFAYLSPASVGDGYTSQFAATYGAAFAAGQKIDVLLQAANVDAPAFAEWLTVTA